MKKRIVSTFLLGCMIFTGLTACGNNTEDVSTESTTEVVTEEKNDTETEKTEEKEVEKESDDESTSNNQYSKNPSPIPILITDKYDSLSADEEDDYFSYAYMNVDGLVIVADGYDNLKEGLQKANQDAWADAAEYKENLTTILEDVNYEKSSTMPWEYEARITLERADENVVSYVTNGYSYLGGAHPNSVMTGHNFDAKTGEEITIKDVFSDVNSLVDTVITKIEEAEAAKSGMLKEDWKETVASLLKEEGDKDYSFSFVIKNNKIHLIFDTYSLGAYALGPVEIDIDEADYDTLVADKYKVSYDALCDSINTYGQYCLEYRFDFDHDGKEELIQIDTDLNDEFGAEDVIVSYGRSEDSLFSKRIEWTYSNACYVMENEEGEYYLYVEVTRENDWKTVEIFDLSNPDKELVEVENKYDNAFYGFIPVDTKHIYVENRFHIMGTYSGYKEAYIDEDGQIKPYDGDYIIVSLNHEAVFEKDAEYPTSINERFYLTALQDIVAYASSDIYDLTTGEDVVIKAGDKVYPYATDGKNYMIFMLEDGSFVKMEYDDIEDNWENTIDGIPEEELFEGIIYAG